jgi:epoxyqueuosine reductase
VSSTTPAPHDLAEKVKALALALGFDLAGISDAVPRPETEFLREWLARGFSAEMSYIDRRVEERVDPRRVLEGARSIISVGLIYDPGTAPGEGAGEAAIARYAGGDDYHDVMIDRLRALESGLAAMVDGPLKTRSYVDTGPVQERVFANYAGLGWIGKNTCLIHPKLGSYLFLGVLLTDLELVPDIREPDHCGSCTACLDACPTDAFVAPYVLDANRCISYTTIEARGPIPESMRAGQGNWVFGCDICQEVCPWNLRERRTVPSDAAGLRERIAPREQWIRPSLRWVLELDEESWRAATRKTAMRRTRYRGLIRNALVAAGNSQDCSLKDAVARHAESEDEMLAEHARWALALLGD